jgi:hypothetical protein
MIYLIAAFKAPQVLLVLKDLREKLVPPVQRVKQVPPDHKDHKASKAPRALVFN